MGLNAATDRDSFAATLTCPQSEQSTMSLVVGSASMITSRTPVLPAISASAAIRLSTAPKVPQLRGSDARQRHRLAWRGGAIAPRRGGGYRRWGWRDDVSPFLSSLSGQRFGSGSVWVCAS